MDNSSKNSRLRTTCLELHNAKNRSKNLNHFKRFFFLTGEKLEQNLRPPAKNA